MIRNIVFDMGGVLMVYDPKRFIVRAGITDASDQALLLKEIYHHPDWKRMDYGDLNEEEMCERAKERLPARLHGVVWELIGRWDVPVIAVAGMERLLEELKRSGYHLYLLSNASLRQPVYFQKVPGQQYFEGKVISSLEKCLKPDHRIYEILLERFHLKAEECLFIDDMPVNVEAAIELGMRGYHFDGDCKKLCIAMQDQFGIVFSEVL